MPYHKQQDKHTCANGKGVARVFILHKVFQGLVTGGCCCQPQAACTCGYQHTLYQQKYTPTRPPSMHPHNSPKLITTQVNHIRSDPLQCCSATCTTLTYLSRETLACAWASWRSGVTFLGPGCPQ